MKILIIFGSMSSEHEISCLSASSILENIDYKKYDINKVGIDKKGNWYLYNGNNENIINGNWIKDKTNLNKITNIINFLKKYDVVFPILHGKYGEDGTIQGILEFAKVKYIGCNVLSSSIAMNKSISKKIVSSKNIPVVDYITLNKKEYTKFTKEDSEKYFNMLYQKFKFPIFTKPNAEGSSYGAKKSNNVTELKHNIEYAFTFDENVLIEKYISNRKEIECAVLENNENLIISTPGEIISANEIYDFNSKYIDKNSTCIIPANIEANISNTIKEYSKDIFKMLELRGMARIDFFVSNKKIYFNEVNTIPGFTKISMFPKMLIHNGISYQEIIDILIQNAIYK